MKTTAAKLVKALKQNGIKVDSFYECDGYVPGLIRIGKHCMIEVGLDFVEIKIQRDVGSVELLVKMLRDPIGLNA